MLSTQLGLFFEWRDTNVSFMLLMNFEYFPMYELNYGFNWYLVLEKVSQLFIVGNVLLYRRKRKLCLWLPV